MTVNIAGYCLLVLASWSLPHKQGPLFSKTKKVWPVGGREYARWIDLGVGIHFKVVVPEKGGS